MQFRDAAFWAAMGAAVFQTAPLAVAQVVDTGSETGVAAKVTAAGPSADKPADAPAASSPAEERSRALLQLKAERAAVAGKGGATDPQLVEIDGRISALQQQIALPQGGLFSDGAQNGAGMPPVYPRIVQEPYEYAPDNTSGESAAGAANSAAAVSPSSFSAPAGTMSPASLDTTASADARKALEQPVSLDAEKRPLVSVVENLAAQTQANIVVNWAALQTAGIDKNTPVTLSLNAVSGARVLRVVLEQAAGSTASLSYTIDDGVVTLSTRDDLSSAKYQMVRVYNVRDFLTVDPQYPLQMAAQVYANRVNNLMDTLKSTVAPDSWRDNGGSVGSIRELDGLLIVNQTNDNQSAVEQMLARLRAVR